MSEAAASPVRVRFAPSPTGYLHVGGVRTAIYNWLFARKNNGVFILRIDDTDAQRHQEEAVRAILEGLQWMGLEWDEGPDKGGDFGPYFQSQRLDRYRAAAEKLEKAGMAYWEKKDAGEVPEWKVKKLQKSGQWDEELARAALDDRPALYFKMHPGEPAPVSFQDAVWGEYSRPADLLQDYVILRADGSPTYNFASAVDDIEMKISHVIRGEDHLANTPKQIRLIEALGEAVPTFVHLPMIHNDKGQKLSKRRDPVSVTVFEKVGILPDALFNYMALLGWSPGDDREFMIKEDMIQAFTLDRINKSPAQFHLKRKSDLPPDASEEQLTEWLAASLPGTKLEWMSGEYLRRLSPESLLSLIRPMIEAQGESLDGRSDEWLKAALRVEQQRANTLVKVMENLAFYLHAPTTFDPKAVKKVLLKNEGLSMLKEVRDMLAEEPDWKSEVLEERLVRFTEQKAVAFGLVAQPIRVALSGTMVSPSIHESLALLGRDEGLRRMDFALDQSFEDQA